MPRPPLLSALRTAVVAIGAAATLALTQSPALAHAPATTHSAPVKSTRTDGVSNVLADYDAEIREATARADGVTHIDTPATIAALKREHVNTYSFLITHASTDWDDLVNEFLPAARQAEINVWVELVPPSECCSEPYEEDYVGWARAIAQLSLRYPNLTAWVIDDFAENLGTFTPAYMQQMQAASHAVNPTLPFFPVVYDGEYTSDFMSTRGQYLDGAIFPYTGDAGRNLNELSDLPGQLNTAIAAMKPAGKRLYLMPYTSPYSISPGPPTAQTIASMIKIGEQYMAGGKLDGVVLYALDKAFELEDCPSPGVANMLALRAAFETPTSGGDYVQASQQITVDPNASSYSITFQQNDAFPDLSFDTGYYDKQLLVDGAVVWDQDPSADNAAEWFNETVDLSAALQGKTTATLAFRLLNTKGVSNFGIQVDFANVSGSGFTVADGDFAGPTGWTIYASSPVLNGLYQTFSCDPQREVHAFASVAAGYGPSSLLYRAQSATGISAVQKTALVLTARTELALHQGGHDPAAAVAAGLLAAQARADGLTVLAEQAASVGTELRG